jgi:hypothetical protein
MAVRPKGSRCADPPPVKIVRAGSRKHAKRFGVFARARNAAHGASILKARGPSGGASERGNQRSPRQKGSADFPASIRAHSLLNIENLCEKLASPARIELATSGLGNLCSILLSYGDSLQMDRQAR